MTYLILVAIIAWALSAGLKRYQPGRKFSGWRVWLASTLGLSICYLTAHADSIGIPFLSWLSPALEDRVGFMALSLCFVGVFFLIQLVVNQVLLRDSNGARLHVSVNIRLCARSILSLFSIPVALVAFHVVALCLIFAV